MLLATALLGASCAHDQQHEDVLPGPGLGASRAPYGATPYYLTQQASEPIGPVGRYSANVPIAGPAIGPPNDLRDLIRNQLAEIDQAAVALTAEARIALSHDVGKTKKPSEWEAEQQQVIGSDAMNKLRDGIEALGPMLEGRSDLVGETDELRDIADRLESARPAGRERLLDRVGRLTDLIRLQIASTAN